jgi:hypothetical protein
MAGERPQIGDLVIRLIGPSVGLFVSMPDHLEHPCWPYDTYTDAVTHATKLARQSRVDVWEAMNYRSYTLVGQYRQPM